LARVETAQKKGGAKKQVKVTKLYVKTDFCAAFCQKNKEWACPVIAFGNKLAAF